MIRGKNKNEIVCPICGNIIVGTKENIIRPTIDCEKCHIRIELDDEFLRQFGIVKH